MRVLVTNDDGIDSPGLSALARVAAELGHEVLVVAPLTDHSGSSAGLIVEAGAGIELARRRLPDLPDAEVIGLDGSPALAVVLARMGAFGTLPRLVLSGINAGPNTGRSVLHSGTVGAILTASTMGMSGLAVSLDADAPKHWETAARVVASALPWLESAPRRVLLNVNVPDLPYAQLQGARHGRLAAYGRSSLEITSATEKELRLRARPTSLPLDAETDEGLVAQGFVSVTRLTGVSGISDEPVAAAVKEWVRSPP